LPIWYGLPMRAKFCSLFIFSFLLSPVCSGADSLSITRTKIDVLQHARVLATQHELTAVQARQKLLAGAGSRSRSSAGFTANIFWLQFTLTNPTSATHQKIIEVDNPQIDWLYVYELDSAGVPILLAETGDKLLFAQRPLLHRNFAIPLQCLPHEQKTILIKIDKRNSSLNFPVFLWSAKAFHEKTYSENLWFGLFFGSILLCMVYALMAFLFLRAALYGWYFLFVLASALYLFTAHGFSFAYLYPTALDFNSYFRVYLIVALFVCLIKFSEKFLSIPRYNPIVHRIIGVILTAFGILAIISFFGLDFLTRNGLWVIPAINTALLLGGFLLIFAALRTYRQQPVIVLIYFGAWGSLLLSYLIMTAGEFGFIAVEQLAVNPVLVGSSVETFIFSVGLTYQIRNVYNERNQLSQNMARQQKDLLKAYVEGSEKERERISRELHDDIGSRLGSLKRFIANDAAHTQTLEEQIDILCRDVRNMSHQLAPPTLHINGLQQLILQLAEEARVRDHLHIDVQFYDVPTSLPEEVTHHLFRITQEAVANILKHAHATEIDLQVFAHETELVLALEDNGKGFDLSRSAKGIGLKNIRARVESLNGTLEISSQPGYGTQLMVRVPLTPSLKDA
jgi:two-component system, sensor histidine kinase LadS